MDVYLRDKFEVSSVILTSFRQVGGGGGKLPPPLSSSKRTPKEPTESKVKYQTETHLLN